jgi:hypothetical protein
MCDYSLHNVASRPAKVGDRLVSTRFTCSLSRGFAAVDQPNVAVCLAPGTEIAFEEDVKRWPFAIFARKVREKVARFRQINRSTPYAHHDALEFPSGQIVMVTNLKPGQRATVLQLPAGPARSDKDAAPDSLVAETQAAQN